MPVVSPRRLRAVGTTVSSAASRGQRVASGIGIRAQRGLNRSRRVPGLLSVVVPCYNVRDYLDDCLVSLRFQRYRKLEIIIVDDGSPDDSVEIAKAHQRRDPRIRIVRQPNGGLSAARNIGVQHARGEFLAFIDSDDVVQPEVFSAPIGALRESGSDFAVTNYDRLDRVTHRPAERHIQRAHIRRRLGVNIDEFPEVMVNATAWSKVYRREFWDRAGLEFPVGKLYEDQPVSMAAYGKATSFDVLPQIGVSWRIRHDKSSISQASNTLRNLEAHHEAVHNSIEALVDAGHPRAAEQRALQVLANNMPFFVRHILRPDDNYVAMLGTAIGDLISRLPQDLYARKVASQNKMLYEFIISGRFEDARTFLTSFGADARRYPTTLGGDGVHCAHPMSESLPRRFTVMSEAQLELMARALRVGLDGSGVLTVEGWCYIRNLDLSEHDFELSLSLLSRDGSRIPMDVTLREEPRADLVGDHYHCDYRPGGFAARVRTGELTAGRGPWEVTATMRVGTIHREGPLLDGRGGTSSIPRALDRGDGSITWIDALRRPLTLSIGEPPRLLPDVEPMSMASVRPGPSPDDDLPVAITYELEDDRFTVEIERPPAGDWRAVMHIGDLRSASVELTGSMETVAPGRARVTFRLIRDHWGRTGRPLPPGMYAIHLVPPAGQPVTLTPHPDLLDRLPFDQPLADHHASVTAFPGPPHSLALRLGPPLRLDEWGLRNQHRLRTEHRVDRADLGAVFFRALYGEVANCNGLGVHQELRRRGAKLDLIWSVTDRSVPVPEGGTGLIEGSREWHDAIARARYQMVNVHQLDWFHKTEGQVVIQTMHGYPYKVMGHAWWGKGRFPGPVIANYDRRAREWDYFVSPATYATPLLRQAFLDPAEAHPEVLEIGYPRNDVLQSQEAAEIRRRTRQLIGARPDQIVVMYAPTFRDYLSADDMTAARVEFFDERVAARQLGDRYLVLVRGHAFNARAHERAASGGNVLDVTDHPDVNDLILASDAAVLDYSSLRFDYALTGKPMVFLVPDLEAYDRARGGVIAYEPTAPGPRVTTTREVVRLLRDLHELRADTAPRIAQFRREYVDLDDGHASARLVDAVFVPRGDAPASD